MPLYFLPFTGLVPDKEHGGDLIRLENAIPALGGLRTLPKPTSDGTVIDRVHSCYVHHYPSGSGTGAYVGDAATEFYGSQSKLYTYAAGAFTDRTAALVFSATPAARRFASYGNDIWGVNFTDRPVVRTNNAGNFANAGTSTFIPEGRFVGVIGAFMIHAALSNAGRYEDEFAWSDQGDASWYDDKTGTRAASLAGTKRILSRPGQIMGFVGGDGYGRFWKRNSIHSLLYTGGSDVWDLRTASDAIGTPCPSSIIECRDGMTRFWGGDGFYAQGGTSPPERIGTDGLAALLIDRDAYLNDVSLRPLATFNDMAEEDGTMFATEDPELGGVFWFYRGEADDPLHGNNRWVYYNYRTDTWALGRVSGVSFSSAGANRNFLSTSTTPPRFIVGTTYDSVGATSAHFRFQDTSFYAITLATQRFAIAQESAEDQAQHVVIEAIQPVVTTRQGTYSTDYQLAALPSTMAVRVVASNEPHFQAQTDELGAQISPRSESRTVADANGFGWMGYSLEGRSFMIELTVPEGSTALRGLRGCWIQYRVL